MPFMENVDELAQWMANSLGIYCEHDDTEDGHTDHNDGKQCRIGFEIEMKDRIRKAVANEAKQ